LDGLVTGLFVIASILSIGLFCGSSLIPYRILSYLCKRKFKTFKEREHAMRIFWTIAVPLYALFLLYILCLKPIIEDGDLLRPFAFFTDKVLAFLFFCHIVAALFVGHMLISAGYIIKEDLRS